MDNKFLVIISNNLSPPPKLVHLSGNSIIENGVPLITGNFWKFKPEFFDKWKVPFYYSSVDKKL